MSSIPTEPVLPRACVDAWHTDTASPAELRRGYARFTRRPPARGVVLRVLRLVAVGLVLGVGLAQAASLAENHWFPRRELQVAAPSGPKSHKRMPLVVAGPKSAPPESAPSDAPHVAHVGSGHAVTATPPAFVQEQWQRAAAALRDHDFVRAEAAFIEIERSVGGSEGDAARLARAQLLASYGRTAEAQALTTDLQDHAQSALVRDKARALLARLTKIDALHRSTNPAPAINQP